MSPGVPGGMGAEQFDRRITVLGIIPKEPSTMKDFYLTITHKSAIKPEICIYLSLVKDIVEHIVYTCFCVSRNQSQLVFV